MKAKDLKLSAVLQFDQDQGLINFKGNRFLLIDAEAMGLLRREIIAVLGFDMARRLLARYGYACGYSDALRLRQEYQWDSEEEWMMAGPMMHMLEGIVQVRPHQLDYSRQEDQFWMEGEWLNSYEAAQHIKHSGVAESPVCWTLSGYASGYATAFFDQQLICVEHECTGKGDPVCRWRISRPHQLGKAAQQALKDLQGFNLAGKISMLEEQIEARTGELSALNAASLILSESLSVDELLNRVLPHVLKATGTSFGRVFLLNEAEDRLELRMQTEPDEAAPELDPIQLHVWLPVLERDEWNRLKSGDLVIGPPLTGATFLPEMSRRHKWRHLARVPLMLRGGIVGVMELASHNPRWPESAEEKRLLLSLGRQIGLALGNARLYEQEQERARAWRGLVEIGHKVASYRDKQQVLESLVEYARELLKGEISFVALLSEDEQTLEVTARTGCRTKALDDMRLPVNQGLARAIMRHGQPVFVAGNAELQSQIAPEIVAEGIISLLAVPLTARGKVLGVLYLGKRTQHKFSDAEADLLKALATQAAIMVENARLHEREIARMKEVELIKADFLAMVTHELRTPLTNIKGISSGLLQKDVEWDEETRHTFLQAINEEADVLTGLVSDLLDMSRLEAGAWTIHLEECTLQEIIREMRRKLVGLPGVNQVKVELEPGLPRLKADPTQIGRVLVNLVTNALKYGSDGPIYLRARTLDQNRVEVAVSDSGPGIPPEARSHIFDKFYRAAPGQPSFTGAGLGLAIVKGIIEAHGERIWLAEPGELWFPDSGGATFCFSLPVFQDYALT